jgi:hypothetical protein
MVETTTRCCCQPSLSCHSTMVLYAVRAIGKWTSSLSHPSTFVVSQEDFSYVVRYKMASCLVYFTFCSKQEQLGIYNHVGRQHNPGWKFCLRTFSTISSCAHGHRSLHIDNCYSLHPGMWRVNGDPLQCIGSVEIRPHVRYVKRSAHGYPKPSSNNSRSHQPLPSGPRGRKSLSAN